MKTDILMTVLIFGKIMLGVLYRRALRRIAALEAELAARPPKIDAAIHDATGVVIFPGKRS